MKYFSFIICLFLSVPVFSQKDNSRVLDAHNFKELVIEGNEIYRINIKTTEKKQIEIITHSEGEYFNKIDLEYKVQQERLVITSKFPENLQGGYDKLSAHKVFSLEMDLLVPEGLEVYIESNIAAVTASGKFKNLQVQLRSGYCNLENFTGNARVNTYSGSIEVEAKNAAIEATSRSGEVILPPATAGKYVVKLQSATGDIRVREN